MKKMRVDAKCTANSIFFKKKLMIIYNLLHIWVKIYAHHFTVENFRITIACV